MERSEDNLYKELYHNIIKTINLSKIYFKNMNKNIDKELSNIESLRGVILNSLKNWKNKIRNISNKKKKNKKIKDCISNGYINAKIIYEEILKKCQFFINNLNDLKNKRKILNCNKKNIKMIKININSFYKQNMMLKKLKIIWKNLNNFKIKSTLPNFELDKIKIKFKDLLNMYIKDNKDINKCCLIIINIKKIIKNNALKIDTNKVSFKINLSKNSILFKSIELKIIHNDDIITNFNDFKKYLKKFNFDLKLKFKKLKKKLEKEKIEFFNYYLQLHNEINKSKNN